MRAESDDMNIGGVMIGGAILIAMILCAAVAAYFLLMHWHTPFAGANTNAPDWPIAGAPLLSEPRGEIERYRADKQLRLHSYGWVDKNAGVAHIPIDIAMQMLIEKSEQRVP
ncbi:MAG TPA: hypothetical protein VGK97_01370 [Spongiibacteraceae bacterium]